MKSVLILLALLLISSGFGRMLLHRCLALRDAPLERFAYGTALGLAVAALGVFFLGLVGQLSFLPITLWWATLALVGALGMLRNAADLLQWVTRSRDARRLAEAAVRETAAVDLTYIRLIAPFTLLVLAVLGLFCLCACFQPPAGHEWDALAYHLADPKVFLLQHRITVLPTEHHSNFPFLMEMLYCVGLLYGGSGKFDGYALANMLHLATGALTMFGVLGFCRRLFPVQTGWIAVLLLATTPLYLWECCVAYIDVGMGLYVTLAVFAATMLIDTCHPPVKADAYTDSDVEPEADTSAGTTSPDRQRRIRDWTLLTGLTLGFALGIKYTSLIPFALIPLLLLFRRVAVRHVALLIGIAALVGSPWYLKSLIWMHNPVYPFLYKLFPSSLYWSADRAVTYQSEQTGFGYEHALAQPGPTLVNLLLTPWRLITTTKNFTNPGDFTFFTLLSGLYVAGILPLVFMRRLPRAVVDLALLLGAQILAWFFMAQVIRYLISFLPIAAVLAAYGFQAISKLDRTSPSHQASRGLRLFPTLITLLLTGQVLFLGWAICALPTSGPALIDPGLMPTSLTLGDALKSATDPDSRQDYLKRRLDLYEVVDWINQSAPTNAGVILYEETRGFYLDRPYLWGNREHSGYIPYDSMKDGAELTHWFLQRGYRYVLINLNWSPQRGGVQTNGHEIELLNDWYIERPPAIPWRFLTADAMRRGLWTIAAHEHGVVVLEIRETHAGENGMTMPGRRSP